MTCVSNVFLALKWEVTTPFPARQKIGKATNVKYPYWKAPL